MQDQRRLIELLWEDERLSEQRLARLIMKPDGLDKERDCPPNISGELGQGLPLTDVALPTSGICIQVSSSWELASSKDHPVPEWEGQASLVRRKEEIEEHSAMIMELLRNIDSPSPFSRFRARDRSCPVHYKLRSEMGRSLLDIHWRYWSPYRKLYGDDTLLRTFAKHDDVVRPSQPATLSTSRDHHDTS
jgi:hypothetical protein